MRDQANMLKSAGHQVKVFAGVGRDPGEGYVVEILPELAPEHELNSAVRSVLERGQSDHNFSKYRTLLIETLDAAFSGFDLVLIHNVFTVHFNLALTRALHDLASRHKMVAWTHDFTATNTDYALPNPTQPPWNLMRMSSPDVTYVAISDLRAQEIETYLKPAITAHIIPNTVDPGRVFDLTPEMRESLRSLLIYERDFVFLVPSRLMVRKNIEFAVDVIKNLIELKRDPLLLITGVGDSNSTAAKHYGDFLRQSLPKHLLNHIVFVSDFFTVHDDTLRDLYLLADCLLYPSRQEGFGLPVVEAALYRLPVLCNNVPAYRAIGGDEAFLLDDLAKLPAAIAWLEAQPVFRQQRKCRRIFDPTVIFRKYYQPLFSTLMPKLSQPISS